MRLSIVTSKNSKQFYVLESYRTAKGKNTSRIVRKLGTYDQLIKEHEDPEAWAREVVAEMNRQAQEGKQKVMVPYSPSELIEKDDERLFDGGYLFLQKIFHQLRLDYICKRIAQQHDFSYNLAEILGHLAYARVLNPASKLSTYEYAQTFLEKPRYELNDVYRALEVIGEEKDYIQSALYQFSKDMGKRNDNILYYDCTNYYFEIEQAVVILLNQLRRRIGHHNLLLTLLRLPVHLSNDLSGPGLRVFVLFDELVVGTEFLDNSG